MATETYDESFSRWRHLWTSVEANADELSHLMGHAKKLAGVTDEAQTAVKEQTALIASKQEKSQQVAQLVALGRVTAEFLTAGLREHYGKKSEKLAEFKIQPLRPRRAKPAPFPTPEVAPRAADPDTTK